MGQGFVSLLLTNIKKKKNKMKPIRFRVHLLSNTKMVSVFGT